MTHTTQHDTFSLHVWTTTNRLALRAGVPTTLLTWLLYGWVTQVDQWLESNQYANSTARTLWVAVWVFFCLGLSLNYAHRKLHEQKGCNKRCNKRGIKECKKQRHSGGLVRAAIHAARRTPTLMVTSAALALLCAIIAGTISALSIRALVPDPHALSHFEYGELQALGRGIFWLAALLIISLLLPLTFYANEIVNHKASSLSGLQQSRRLMTGHKRSLIIALLPCLLTAYGLTHFLHTSELSCNHNSLGLIDRLGENALEYWRELQLIVQLSLVNWAIAALTVMHHQAWADLAPETIQK